MRTYAYNLNEIKDNCLQKTLHIIFFQRLMSETLWDLRFIFFIVLLNLHFEYSVSDCMVWSCTCTVVGGLSSCGTLLQHFLYPQNHTDFDQSQAVDAVAKSGLSSINIEAT